MEKEKKKVLIVIDVQNDFVTGVLGTPEAQAIVPNVKKKFDEYKNNKNYVILTKDTHHSDYADTSEGRKLPEHCMMVLKVGKLLMNLIIKISIVLWYVVNLLLDLMTGIGKKYLVSHMILLY